MHLVTSDSEEAQRAGLRLINPISRTITIKMPAGYHGKHPMDTTTQTVEYKRTAMLPDKPGEKIRMNEWKTDDCYWAQFRAPKVEGFEAHPSIIPAKKIDPNGRPESVTINYVVTKNKKDTKNESQETKKQENLGDISERPKLKKASSHVAPQKTERKGSNVHQNNHLSISSEEKRQDIVKPTNNGTSNLTTKEIHNRHEETAKSAPETAMPHSEIDKKKVYEHINQVQRSMQRDNDCPSKIELDPEDKALLGNPAVAKAIAKYQVVGKTVFHRGTYKDQRFTN